MENKPNVLILGGCGFIGRNMVQYLVENDLTNKIRVVDKTPPQMAWLNERHARYFENENVEFLSANLKNSNSCKTVFSSLHPWHVVINCAAETRSNQTDAVYEEGIYHLSVNCAKEAALMGVERYIELGSGCLKTSKRSPLREDCDAEAWSLLAIQKLKVEEELSEMSDLSYTILRLPIVYGLGDKQYLMPRIVIASIYKYLNETMKLLWDDKMRLDTVHVEDVCGIIWTMARSPKAHRKTYNIVDDSSSTQGTISNLLADIFNIDIDYFGTVVSNLSMLAHSDMISEINDKHMTPWAEICQQNNIINTPLTPYLSAEQLCHNHLHLDNTKMKDFDYILKHPKITTDHIKAIIDDYVQQKLFPKSLMM